MKYSQDLSWLSAPAFFLIVGLLAWYTIKQTGQPHHPEKIKSVISVLPAQKSA